ncbi:DUF6035 family protein [Rhodopseudomonas parapalustris]
MTARLQRTLKRAVRLQDMTVISSDDLLRIDADGYQAIRRSATRARNEGQPAFVCDHCGFAVYAPREPKTRLPFWRHHKGAPRSCPWWTGEPGSTDDVSASQFQGAQESPLHLRVKHLVAELLAADPHTEPGSVVIDEYVVYEESRRRPDVRAIFDGKPIAIEIQLATTQIPIIVAREDFYRREGRHLIWLTWNFVPVERAHLLTAFEDIFYSHNKNLFSLDDEVVSESRTKGAFLVRAFWEHGSGWNSKITTLPGLEWPSSGLPYAVAPPAPWHLEFRSRWLTATTVHGTPWPARSELLSELAKRLADESIDVSALEEADVGALLNAILSFVDGKPVGSAQRNLTEVINTFLASERRFRFARIMRKVVVATGMPEILDKPSVAAKFARAMEDPQDGPESLTGRVGLLLFSELFEKRQRTG